MERTLEDLQAAKENVGAEMAADFLNGPAQFVMHKLDLSAAAERAKRVFDAAVSLAYQLWSEKTYVQPYELADLAQGGRRFALGSELLESHPLHKLEAAEDGDEAHRLDGQVPRIVTFPAILLYGTSDAEDYDNYSILIAAQVWLDDDDKPPLQ
jgi:hypothetical protein